MNVVKVEFFDTPTSDNGTPYSGEGNFQGDVDLVLTYENGSFENRQIGGEHSVEDLKVNYLNPKYWNE